MKRGIAACLSLLITLIATKLSLGQLQQGESFFDHLTNNEGLSHQVVHSILQDREGFIWMGTEDGLNRFDGYQFTIFRNKRGDNSTLPDNFIYSLYEDSKGFLWIGTNNGGLSRYDKASNTFKNYSYDSHNPQSINSNRVMAIQEDANGTLWIATYFGGLNFFDREKETFSHFVSEEGAAGGLPTNDINDIAFDADGKLWLATVEGMVRYDIEMNSFSVYSGSELRSNSFNSVFIDQDGHVWAGSTAELLKLNTSTNVFEDVWVEAGSFPLTVSVRDIHQTEDGTLWIGTEKNGVITYDIASDVAAQYKNNGLNERSLASDEIMDIIHDFSGNLWVSVNGKGVDKMSLNKKKFKTFRKEAGKENTLSTNTIRSLLKSSDGTAIWAGTMHYGLNKVDLITGETSVYGTDNDFASGLSDNSAVTIMEDSRGRLWVGTWEGGISVFDDPNDLTTASYYRHDPDNPSSIRSDQLQDLYEDGFGNIWVGTETGLDLLNTQTGEFRHFNHDPNSLNSMTQYGVQSGTINQDKYGNIWVSTWDGLNKIIPDSYTENSFDVDYRIIRFQNQEGNQNSVSDNRIISIYYDEEKYPENLFLGTYGGGINMITIENTSHTNIQVEVFTTADGLPNNVIYSILGDKEGNLWLSTNKGLSRFNPADKTFKNYDVNDGLQGNQFFWGSAYQAPDGELLFGGTDGFNSFYPSEIVSDNIPPKVYVTDFKVDNKDVVIGQKYSGNILLEQSIINSNEIVLSYKENFFSFGFAALHYAYPQNNRYQYMMEGFDEQWIETSSEQRVATYTNLNPGDYVFKVKGSNYDGMWIETPTQISISITPPFYKTTLFYLIVVVVAGALIYFFIRFREKQLQKDKDQLEEAILTKSNELQQTKDEIIAKNEADKTRNWLASTMSEISKVISKNKDDVFELSSEILTKLIKVLNAQQGAIMILNDDNEDDQYLELLATYAYSELKKANNRIEVESGLAGNCFKTAETNYITDLPESYTSINMGLGEAHPSYLLLVPFRLEDKALGVIEIASFEPMEDHHIRLVEQVGENVASTIYILKMSNNTNNLLEQSRQQAEELKAQEEELRQNMEELEATSESFHRREEELKTEVKKWKTKFKEATAKIT